MDVPETVTCVDCGQPARRLSYRPEEGWEPGDFVAYRCTGCNDRWDLEVSDEVEDVSAMPSFSAEARSIMESRAGDKR